MKNHHLWILLISIQGFFSYGQTHTMKDTPSKPLDMDQARLTISNSNYPDSILVMLNKILCEHCDFDQFHNPVPMNASQTHTIDSKYPYDFQLFPKADNKTLLCHINSYSFSEHGSYFFEIIQNNQNQTSCTITQTEPSSYYWTPIIVALILLSIYVLSIQFLHFIYNRRNAVRYLTNTGHQRLVNDETNLSPTTNRRGPPIVANAAHTDDVISTLAGGNSELPLVASTKSTTTAKVFPKRLRALDTFRGFALMVMIFVNYGGGGYWFFDHSAWNGLTIADLVFPWFNWMMGVSIVLSQRSLRAKNVRRRDIFLKIARRTATLFLLGLVLQGGDAKPKDLRILGVLQRLALCYFFAALLVLVLDPDETHSTQWPTGNDVRQPMRLELSTTVFRYWSQWLVMLTVTLCWILITFVPKLSNCPRGYIGPGGKHQHGQYQNCTGGVAGYLDRLILGDSHLYNYPTCKDIYDTKVPYDPEGLLGILTGTLLCYLGVQAGHSFVHSTTVRRVCSQWLVSGLICGFFGLLLSKGGHSESWIPINKNMWSLTFILILASLAFIIITILYLLVDVYKWFTGEPWLWLGMNSIVLYVGHDICDGRFPVQFKVEAQHAAQLAMNLYGSVLWSLVAGVLYYKKIFIAI